MSEQQNRHGEVTFPCWDGEYTFRLAIGDIRKLQEITGVGPKWLINRLAPFNMVANPQGDNWRVDDYREVIRLGLLRAGKTSDETRLLLVRFVDDCPAAENVQIAFRILAAWLVGAPEEAVGKEEEPPLAMATDGSSTTDELPSHPSTAPAAPASDGLQPRSTI